jgi:hypothetical protein
VQLERDAAQEISRLSTAASSYYTADPVNETHFHVWPRRPMGAGWPVDRCWIGDGCGGGVRRRDRCQLDKRSDKINEHERALDRLGNRYYSPNNSPLAFASFSAITSCTDPHYANYDPPYLPVPYLLCSPTFPMTFSSSLFAPREPWLPI